MREKFLPGNLPGAESRDDYDGAGLFQLGPEYADWFHSAENGLRPYAVLAWAGEELRIASPLPGSIYVVDPDIPSSRSIPLVVAGGKKVSWKSDSLECVDENGRESARASEGEHRITVTDLESGRTAETWIRIRSL